MWLVILSIICLYNDSRAFQCMFSRTLTNFNTLYTNLKEGFCHIQLGEYFPPREPSPSRLQLTRPPSHSFFAQARATCELLSSYTHARTHIHIHIEWVDQPLVSRVLVRHAVSCNRVSGVFHMLHFKCIIM